MIFITGTPTTGKSTVAKELALKMNLTLIDVKDIAVKNNMILGVDDKRGYKIVDIDAFDKYLSKCSDDSVVESHLSHFFSNPSKVVVLRVHPDILEERLKKRGYSDEKIRENLEAEALGVCSVEAYENHGSKVFEIDCSNLKVSEIVDIIIADDESAFGEVDFMDWFL